MLQPNDELPGDEVAPEPPAAAAPESPAEPEQAAAPEEPAVPEDLAMAEAVCNLRALILAGERYRLVAAGSVGLGTTESQAISYLALHGARGSRSWRATSASPAAPRPPWSTGWSGTASRPGCGTRTTAAASSSS